MSRAFLAVFRACVEHLRRRESISASRQSEAERGGLAATLEIAGVDSACRRARRAAHRRARFSVRGWLTAIVVQTDVVTLEPVRQEVAEEIEVMLMPAEEAAR